MRCVPAMIENTNFISSNSCSLTCLLVYDAFCRVYNTNESGPPIGAFFRTRPTYPVEFETTPDLVQSARYLRDDIRDAKHSLCLIRFMGEGFSGWFGSRM